MVRSLILALIMMAAAASIAKAQSPQVREFVLRPGDQVQIAVLEDPGLNTTALVRPDGFINMPLAGSVEVIGRTPEAVAQTIRRALVRDFVEPPTVTVSLLSLGAESTRALQQRRASVFVLGQVGSQGRYEVELPADVLQVLALAGGPGTFAARRRIQVRRRPPGGPEQLMVFDYDSLERGVLPTQDIQLMDGDVIVVPERRLFE